MKIIFVRHGESVHGAVKARQFGHSQLSENGIKQAESLAQRCRNLSVDLILSSDFSRASQTAEIINKQIHKKIIYTELLREVKRPSEVEGKEIQDPEAVKIIETLKAHHNDPGWHFTDEENFYDSLVRVKKFMDYVVTLENNVLCVTHGIFIKMIAAYLLMKGELTPDFFYGHFQSFFGQDKTGITILEKDYKDRWFVSTWNDHTHL